ncbi:N-acetyl-gamma-glutamyl-phosphate reductase [uncultured delta proteobacterium]|uniref:N-acetyl-gamma-glutamyl-phosphate reductase n=1 Tax=uncultured delta proteobacterium TaxID=34034 RepID=A0A212JWI1_9DELT|nr:N-acetyl-gamma-glutamyl-phosphate reductase [uncultured delta proteobacterium]
MAQIRAGLVGVTGYTGMELVRLLENHPSISLVAVTSRSDAGKKVRDIYPFMQGFATGELVITAPDAATLAKECDVVFLAVPHGVAMEMAAAFRAEGVAIIDLSADFRLRDVAVFEEWYKAQHAEPFLLKEAVYGLPELYAKEIAAARLIANPGCYPTASILALAPALKNKFIDPDGIVIDAKSGTTGAGRKAVVGSLYCEVADTFKAYNLTKHRHTPEIEQELSLVAGKAVTLSFNTHLLPINRGILATIYTQLAKDVSFDAVYDAYVAAYEPHTFVRVLPKGAMPELRNVRGTMFCDISLVHDPRINRLIIVSAIDNMCRGASGQAIANANLMHGLPLETGLMLAPMVP